MCPAPRSQPSTNAKALSMTRRLACSGKLSSSLIGHHRPVVCGLVRRVVLLGEISKCLAIVLPRLAHGAILDSSPIGGGKLSIPFCSDFLPREVTLALFLEHPRVVHSDVS